MNGKRFLVSVFAGLALMISGCTSVRSPDVLRGSPAELTLNFRDCEWDFSGTRAPGESEKYKKGFLSAIDSVAYVNMEAPGPDDINIAIVRIATTPRGGIGPTITPMVFSSPILPLSFVRNRYYKRVFVSYAIADQDGEITRQARRQHTIRSSFAGWSFTRLFFRHKAVSRVSRASSALAAELMVEDIIRRKFE